MVQPAPVRRSLVSPSRAIRYDARPRIRLLSFQQTDVVADHVDNPACSGLSGGGQTANIALRQAGPAGVVPRSFDVTTVDARAHIYLQTSAAEINREWWDGGTWTVRLNVTGLLGVNAKIRTCHICRIGPVFGLNKGTVAARTDLNIPCSAGLKTWTMRGSRVFGDPLDRIQVVIGISGVDFVIVTVEITPNQRIDSPLTKAA